jgi:hypothetical protein
MSENDQQLNTCGCCQGVHRATPAAVDNLPGLTALVYRCGTHGSFKASMQSAVSGQSALQGLTTREDGDPALALLDGWATILDVLSFYQERIANEGYLRTATERRSILELARSIGYELRPGVAAGTFLSFNLETAPGAPLSTKIPIGTKAQSTPAQDEKPQTFETVEPITGYAAFNALRARQTEPVPPLKGVSKLYLKGTATNLKAGDAILIVGDERIADPTNENWDFRILTDVVAVPPAASIDVTEGYTIIELDRPLGSIVPPVNPAAVHPRIFALRQRASLFGYNAPDWKAMPDSLKAAYVGLDPKTVTNTDLEPYAEWPNFSIAGTLGPPPGIGAGTGLHGEYFNTIELMDRVATRTDATINFDLGTNSPIPGVVNADNFSVRWSGWVEPKESGSYMFYVNSDDGARLWINGKLIVDAWKIQSATETSSSVVKMTAGRKYEIRLEYFEKTGAALVKLSWSATAVTKETIPATQLYPLNVTEVLLDTVYPKIVPGGWAVLSNGDYQELYSVPAIAEDARANFALSGKVSRLKLQGEFLGDDFNLRLRDTAVYGQSEELLFGERPIPSAVPRLSSPAQPLDRFTVELNARVEGLVAGQLVSLTGIDHQNKKPVAEVATIDQVVQSAGFTRLIFKAPLANNYERTSLVLNANVARATHGDTKDEVLGSGDGSRVFQKFDLKQKPLTYVSAASASGAETTLEVRVNDILWHEKPTFYGLPPTERAYIARLADDGKVTVQFGDGITGARLPTGTENVTAKYRVGIGLPGMLAANQLNLLMSRPLGLKDVINPLAPTGAEDPELRDGARQNSPLTVLTLDRIVSQQDFEDFSRAYAGIGKAQATWLWNGERRLIHLTIAGVDGGPVPVNSELFGNLTRSIDASRHTDQVVRIGSYQKRSFAVEAKLLIDPDYLVETVKSAVTKALIAEFSFERRAFGQAVTSSEIVAVAQGVAGVVGVDLDKLSFDTPGSPSLERLPANVAHWTGSQIEPAELLTVNPDRILLTEMK